MGILKKLSGNWYSNIINRNGLKEIRITRYNYDTWKVCAPEGNGSREAYEINHMPGNLMSFYYYTYRSLKLNLVKDKDVCLRALPFDEYYFEWLKNSGLEDSEESREQFNLKGLTEEEMTEKLEKWKLNRSVYAYVIPVMGCLSGNELDMQLSAEERDAVTAYFQRLVGPGGPIENPWMDVWVSPYIFSPESIIYDIGRISSMAEAWFNDGQDARIGNYSKLSLPEFEHPEDLYTASFYLPVFIQENHKNRPVTIEEIEETMFGPEGRTVQLRNVGRFLQYFNTLGCIPGVVPFEKSQGGQILENKCKTIFTGNEEGHIPGFLISINDVPDFHNKIMKGIAKSAKKEGLQLHKGYF